MAVYLGEPLQEEQVVTFPELNLVWLRSTANAIVVANQVIKLLQILMQKMLYHC